ncbi:MAG: NAD(P)-dependent oxidoreductase [Rhabdochlamydiaceae bacterium]|jgi:nucleoside-diphosphate-sugar epimerase
MEKKVVIVTGACGRIGANVVRKLGTEFRVVGFELLKAIYASANEELVPVDLGSDESVHQAFTHIRQFYGNKIASVVHLAAYYSFSDQNYDNYERITVRGTERLLKALSNFEVEQFIFSSTMLVHAPCKIGEKIDEKWPVEAKWAYPRSKVATEKLIHDLRGKIPTVILRIAGVYDDECHSIPISNQIKRIYEKQLEAHLFAGNIHSGASFLHMDDLVSAINLCIQKRSQLPPETVMLLGEPKTLSYDDLQREISRLLFGKEFKTFSIPKWLAKIGSFVENHLPFMPKPFIKPWMIDFADDNYTLDISLAKQLLSWKPNHFLETTLPVMINALKKDPAQWYKINGLK